MNEELEESCFDKLETVSAELQDLKDLVGVLMTECFDIQPSQMYEYVCRFENGRPMCSAVLNLLGYLEKDLADFIDTKAKERKAQKGV